VAAASECAAGTQRGALGWGLDRLDALPGSGPLDGAYETPSGSAGAGVHVFVLDTGVRATHEDLAGRVTAGFGLPRHGGGSDDDNGHGTHCAALASGTVFGAAKCSQIVPVKVLGADGLGTFEDVLEGLEWVAENGVAPGVVSMSLAGPVSQAIGTAIQRLDRLGFLVVVAAGNQGSDACRFSPAANRLAFAVGSTDLMAPDGLSESPYVDVRSGFSNFGDCVDVYAPGSSIRSASHESDSAETVRSGTSMSCPLVAGIAALYFGMHPRSTPADARAAILQGAVSLPQGAFAPDLSPRLASIAMLEACADGGTRADCVLGPWSSWSGECPAASSSCGEHWQGRRREVLRPARCGGRACGETEQSRPCRRNDAAVRYPPCTEFYPTQWFGSTDPETRPAPAFDLEGQRVRLTPSGRGGFEVCLGEAGDGPLEALGANRVRLPLGDDDFAEIVLGGEGSRFPFYSESHRAVYVGSNGFVTFSQGDNSWSAATGRSRDPGLGAEAQRLGLPIGNHWARPRISVLFQDLDPTSAGEGAGVFYEVLTFRGLTVDPRLVITWDRVPIWGFTEEVCTMQLVLHLSGSPRAGEVEMWWGAASGRYLPVVGVSPGGLTSTALGSTFEETNFFPDAGRCPVASAGAQPTLPAGLPQGTGEATF